MNYITGTCTDIGIARELNQDSVCIMQAETKIGNACMAIVCDGMGGLSKGEVASASVVSAFANWFEQELAEIIKNNRTDEILDIWEKEIHYLSDRMKDYAIKTKNILGTTFSGILLIEDEYFWVHVGDSRIYKSGLDELVQITSDHTVTARAVANGEMTPEEAAHSKLRSRLTQCVGASQVLEPEKGRGRIHVGESFLVCSDGFYHRLTLEEIKELCDVNCNSDRELDDFCDSAVRTVMRRGEKDNISVAVIKSH